MLGKAIYFVLGSAMKYLIDSLMNKYPVRSPEKSDPVEVIYEDACNIAKNSNPLHIIQNIDASKIIGVNFIESSGRRYSISLETIKKIAVYIQGKYHKTSFKTNELRVEADFLWKNFQSSLPPEQYNILKEALETWIKTGGVFSIECKNEPIIITSHPKGKYSIFYWAVIMPFIIYSLLFGLCILDIISISVANFSFIDSIEPGMHGFYGILFLVFGIWVPFVISIPIFLIGIFWKKYKTGRFLG